MYLVLSKAEESILETLSKHVRVLSMSQLESLVEGGEKTIRNVTSKLSEKGLIEIRESSLPRLPGLKAPLYRVLAKREIDCSFESLAWQLTKRGRNPLEPTRYLTITRQGANKVGGWVLKPKVAQLFHDLCVSQVFINYWKNHRVAAECWEPEDLIAFDPGFRSPTPDAFITNLRRVVEIGGPSYSAQRLRALHETFAPNFEYELW